MADETQEPTQEPVQTEPKPVVPDEVIKPLINEEVIKELSNSIKELKEVQRDLFEQKNIVIKGENGDEDEQLIY